LGHSVKRGVSRLISSKDTSTPITPRISWFYKKIAKRECILYQKCIYFYTINICSSFCLTIGVFHTSWNMYKDETLTSVYNDSHLCFPTTGSLLLTLKNEILISTAKIEKIGNFYLMSLVLIIPNPYFNCFSTVSVAVCVWEYSGTLWCTRTKKITKMFSLKISVMWHEKTMVLFLFLFLFAIDSACICVIILRSMWPHCNKIAETLKTVSQGW